MLDYCRNRVPDRTFFFTANLRDRRLDPTDGGMRFAVPLRLLK